MDRSKWSISQSSACRRSGLGESSLTRSVLDSSPLLVSAGFVEAKSCRLGHFESRAVLHLQGPTSRGQARHLHRHQAHRRRCRGRRRRCHCQEGTPRSLIYEFIAYFFRTRLHEQISMWSWYGGDMRECRRRKTIAISRRCSRFQPTRVSCPGSSCRRRCACHVCTSSVTDSRSTRCRGVGARYLGGIRAVLPVPGVTGRQERRHH